MAQAFVILSATVVGLLALLIAMRVVRTSSPTAWNVDESIRLIDAYVSDGRSMEAMVVSKKLAREAPRSLRVRFLLVDVLCARERHAAALEELHQLALERPNNDEVEARIATLTATMKKGAPVSR